MTKQAPFGPGAPEPAFSGVIRLRENDTRWLAEMLTHALAYENTVLVQVDPVDKALKVKVSGRWSPPLGEVAR